MPLLDRTSGPAQATRSSAAAGADPPDLHPSAASGRDAHSPRSQEEPAMRPVMQPAQAPELENEEAIFAGVVVEREPDADIPTASSPGGCCARNRPRRAKRSPPPGRCNGPTTGSEAQAQRSRSAPPNRSKNERGRTHTATAPSGVTPADAPHGTFGLTALSDRPV